MTAMRSRYYRVFQIRKVGFAGSTLRALGRAGRSAVTRAMSVDRTHYLGGAHEFDWSRVRGALRSMVSNFNTWRLPPAASGQFAGAHRRSTSRQPRCDARAWRAAIRVSGTVLTSRTERVSMNGTSAWMRRMR